MIFIIKLGQIWQNIADAKVSFLPLVHFSHYN